MSDLNIHLEQLANAARWPYRAGRESAAEPAAWAAIALAARGRTTEALRPAAWLAGLQQSNGAVGVSAAEPEPRWTTSLALIAWQVVDRAVGRPRFEQHIASAVRWSLADHGKTASIRR